MNQRDTNKDSEQTLISHSRKGGSDEMKRMWKQGKGKPQNEARLDSKEKRRKFEERSESSKGGG